VLYLVVKMGNKVKVKIIAIDPVNGKVKLSRRQALTSEESAAEVERLGLTAGALLFQGSPAKLRIPSISGPTSASRTPPRRPRGTSTPG
jgi:predicted RNA-binding protein with RPS1 domain